MSEEIVRKHLRAALDEVVAAEKDRLRKLYDESDANIERRVEMMKPVIDALKAMTAEVGGSEGLSISPSAHGHMASVNLNTSASRQSLSISTDMKNAEFEIRENLYYTFSSEGFERVHRFSSEEDVLRFIVEAVGKHVASNEVLDERKE
jgi:DNA primase catalytic subunit